MTPRSARIGVAVALVVVLIGGLIIALRSTGQTNRTHVVGYFAN
ncbi:MAG: hypothetical protein QOE41_3293, partial [Mycobacterium sp.]|nr:hypothetical protein [Mycobacterium sp.]